MSRLLDRVAPPRLGSSFRWLLGSSWMSNIGDGIALAAGPLLVASLTNNAFLVAMAALLQRLPWLIFGLYRTQDGYSDVVSSGDVLFTLIGMAGLYFVLGLLYLYLVGREILHGPDDGGSETARNLNPEPISTGGAHG